MVLGLILPGLFYVLILSYKGLSKLIDTDKNKIVLKKKLFSN
jgi:hypothetical protein